MICKECKNKVINIILDVKGLYTKANEETKKEFANNKAIIEVANGTGKTVNQTLDACIDLINKFQ